MIRRASGVLAMACVARSAHAQVADSTSRGPEVAAAITVTTKGISTIPSFTLGKPAAIFDVSISKHRLSFEPQFRFGLDGKPWSFLFWGRYKLLETKKLRVGIGVHPAISFRTIPATTSGDATDVIAARRYLAGELSPTYVLSRHASVGAYWLYSYGVEPNVAKHTNFLAMRSTFTSGAIGKGYVVRLAPQLYYLRADDRDGYYAYSGLSLTRASYPFTLSTVVNKTIRSDVPGSDDLLWNVSLAYAIR